MKICRFRAGEGPGRIGLVSEEDAAVTDLTAGGIAEVEQLLEADDARALVRRAAAAALPRLPLKGLRLETPVDRQEIWAAGVTYLRSKDARMEESEFSASAYDRVYAAERPEIFFKAPPGKAVPAGEPVGIRHDAKWSVPEPELALVLNSAGRVVGYTIGNDMSSRDIEGENLLYLPQAKIYQRSCALGPWLLLGAGEAEARSWKISLRIARDGAVIFEGETSAGRMKREFSELAAYLFRCQVFPHGAVLLTGTGIVPPDGFSLQAADRVTIKIDGIGVLENDVAVV